MSLISINKINKYYGTKNNRNHILKDVSLEINEGDFIAIMGTSGSGKSTLLNILGLLDKYDQGDYFLKDSNIKNLKDKNLALLRNTFFGFVVQNFALIDDFSVYENVEIPLEYGKVSNKVRKEKINEILKSLDIFEKLNDKAKNLSGGQKQRVAIARALVNNPSVILADEPTGALDTKTTEEIMNIFKELNQNGKTIIIITHDEKVAAVCDKILRIEDGILSSKLIPSEF